MQFGPFKDIKSNDLLVRGETVWHIVKLCHEQVVLDTALANGEALTWKRARMSRGRVRMFCGPDVLHVRGVNAATRDAALVPLLVAARVEEGTKAQHGLVEYKTTPAFQGFSRGNVNQAQLLRTQIQSLRDAIPVADWIRQAFLGRADGGS